MTTAPQAHPAVTPGGFLARVRRFFGGRGMSDDGTHRRPLERIYGPLGDHLAARAAAGEHRVALPFAAIEGLLGRPLPATARSRRNHRTWWGGVGGRAPHAWHGWQRHGWTVAAVDLAAEMVTLTRPPGTA